MESMAYIRSSITNRWRIPVLFGLLACFSLLAQVVPALSLVCIPGMLLGLLYSVLFTHIGPIEWGHTEVLIMLYRSARFQVWIGVVTSFKVGRQTRPQ